MKVIDKLSTYAALIGVVSAIGGGFYAWGEFNNRISVLEKKKFVVNETVNLDPVNEKISSLEVELIDRIKKVDDKIIKTDLTLVFKEIAKVREEMALLDIPDDVDLKPISKELKRLSEELVRIVATIPKVVDLKPLLSAISELEKNVAIARKENELQDILIEEIKTKANNPLAN
jgi:hypothetical protein